MAATAEASWVAAELRRAGPEEEEEAEAEEAEAEEAEEAEAEALARARSAERAAESEGPRAKPPAACAFANAEGRSFHATRRARRVGDGDGVSSL